MSFWSKASTEQRLAQIDGAIELGMTSKQVAKNCGVHYQVLLDFARQNGRHFSRNSEEAVRKRRLSMAIRTEIGNHVSARLTYERAGFDPSNLAGARLFPNDRSTNLFDPTPLDEEVFA